MHKQNFGFSKLLNDEVILYGISNENNVKVNILSIGAAIQSIYLPWNGYSDSKKSTNVVLGYSNVEDYEDNDCYIGVAVGRVAGRISNAQFKVDENSYEVTKNKGKHCLHGGRIGLSRKQWNLVTQEAHTVTLQCTSVDKEEGFPGDMVVTVTYTITSDNALIIRYHATVDKHACPINLTNHSYFNLSGIEAVDKGIKDHVVEICSSKTLELDKDLLPTGKIVPLSSDLDLRNNRDQLKCRLPKIGGDPKGFDNYYIFDHPGIDHVQAVVSDGVTKMSLLTDQIGVQFYTANFFDNVKCSGDCVHHQHGALCLEAQNYPDATNHEEFPSIILRPQEAYSQQTVYRFEKV